MELEERLRQSEQVCEEQVKPKRVQLQNPRNWSLPAWHLRLLLELAEAQVPVRKGRPFRLEQVRVREQVQA